MELSRAQQKIAFGVIVFALVALGAYLVRPAAHSAGQLPAPSATRAGSARTAPPPQSSPQQVLTGSANIYQWLPFSQAGLTAAASVVARFGAAYGTFSYTQTAASYVRPLLALCTPQLADQIEAAYSTPGVAVARDSGKQVVTGTATIESIRAFGPASLTFVVLITERISQLAGPKVETTSYAVTVAGGGSHWQITDIELATAGNS